MSLEFGPDTPSSIQVPIDVQSDDSVEGDEMFSVILTASPGDNDIIIIGRNEAQITIMDNDSE